MPREDSLQKAKEYVTKFNSLNSEAAKHTTLVDFSYEDMAVHEALLRLCYKQQELLKQWLEDQENLETNFELIDQTRVVVE